jgi:hypothetical protein
MTPDHQLQVLSEEPVIGLEANEEAWKGYTMGFPDYVIYPDRICDRGHDVVVCGATTGSHLGLPDDQERQLGVIWRAIVRDGRLTRWQILEDTPAQREILGL